MADSLMMSQQNRSMALEAVALDAPIAIERVPTPALIIDRAALEGNLKRMQAHLDGAGKGLRAHAKMHKCPHLAQLQLQQGALGICCAKVSEAEVMAAAGIGAILITSPIATVDKMQRVAALAARIDELMLVVDRRDTLAALNAAVEAAGTRLRVLVDLDPHMGRTGIAQGQPALDLVRAIAAQPALQFAGLQQYAGQIMHIADADDRHRKARELAAEGMATRALIEADGHTVPVFTGGGTGTFDIDSEIEGITDLQVGSYAFMDAEYRAIAQGGQPRFEAFEPALFVLVTAISQPRAGLLTVDGGIKSFATDTVAPEPFGVPGARYHFGGDEHGILQLDRDDPAPPLVGDRLWMIASHCDPTVNLFDWYWVVDEDSCVRELWPVSARGCSA